jgi:hypothetical protein
VLCSEVHKRREKVRGGECVDVGRNFTTSKMIMLFVFGCYESELCLHVIMGCIHSVGKKNLKRN